MEDDEEAKAFRRLARELIMMAKEGRHAEVMTSLSDLLSLKVDRWEYTNKKNHLLDGLALEALRHGHSDLALRYLDIAAFELDESHLQPNMVQERRTMRQIAERVRGGDSLDACLSLPPVKVAFVCDGNAARSPMAEAFLRARAGIGWQVVSGGTRPAKAVAPEAVKVMQEKGIDISRHRPRRIPPSHLDAFDCVITFGGDPGEIVGTGFRGRLEVWKVPDPKGAPLESFRRIRDEIEGRVDDLAEEFLLRRGPSGGPRSVPASRWGSPGTSWLLL